jgi:hypothetical protein
VISLGVAACVPDRPVSGIDVTFPPPGASAPGPGQEYANLPNGPCLPSVANAQAGTTEIRDPIRCIAAYKTGRIAVVDLSGNLAAAQRTAAEAEAMLRQATGGIIKASFTAIEASADTKAAVAVYGCIDPNDDTGLASVIADEDMPGLHQQANMVVALSTAPPCVDASTAEVGGVADSDASGKHRHADVYVAKGGPDPESYGIKIAAAVVHEVLHDFDLNHASDAQGNTDLNTVIPQAPNVFALETYLANLTVKEYAQPTTDPMGGPTSPSLHNLQLSPVHKNDLLTPYIELGEKQSLAIDAAKGGAAITPAEAAAGHFAAVRLPQPYTPAKEADPTVQGGSTKGLHTYGRLNFVPKADSVGLDGIAVYLSGADNSTLYLGLLRRADSQSKATWTISTGGEKIVLALDRGAMTVAVAK